MRLPSTNQRAIAALQTRLSASREPDARARLLVQLAEAIWPSSAARARFYLEKAVSECAKARTGRWVPRAAEVLVDVYRGFRVPRAGVALVDELYGMGIETGDRLFKAASRFLAAVSDEASGRLTRAAKRHDMAARLAASAGNEQWELAARCRRGMLAQERGSASEAVDCFNEVLTRASASQDSYFRVLAWLCLGRSLLPVGQWSAATEYLFRAVADAERLRYTFLLGGATVALSELYLFRDQLSQAYDTARAAARLSRRQRHWHALLEAKITMGRTQTRMLRTERAERLLSEAMSLSEHVGIPRYTAIACRELAELAVTAGQLTKAQKLLAVSRRARFGPQVNDPEEMRVRALLAAAKGQTTGAGRLYAQTERALEKRGDIYGLARLRLAYARFRLGIDDRPGATALLRKAALTFRRLSVTGYLDEVADLLRGLGGTARAGSRAKTAVRLLLDSGKGGSRFFELVLETLCELLSCSSGTVFVGRRAAVVHGRPDISAARKLAATGRPVLSGKAFYLPVRADGKHIGGVYLERVEASATMLDKTTAGRIAEMLSDSLKELAGAQPSSRRARAVPGLEYRGVIGPDRAMHRVLKVVKRIAGTRVPVLVRGESGTGKELIARALHDSGRRKDGPLVAVNCAAVPASLLEAELFGVVKGAATGVGARKGRFELAHGGTLLLDEIGDMRPPLQAKLLRVLQEGEVFPVGSQRPVKVNVRIVSASNKNLEAMIRRGQFREDLYYRLNAVELRLPPLRERTGDIPALLDHFLGQIGREYGREKTGVTAEVIERFLSYRWPGNIRQLRHVLEQAVLLTDGPVVTVDDLPAAIRKLRPVMQRRRPGAVRRARLSAEKQAAEAVVRDRLVKCLEQTEGNITRAAKLAGYSRVHFYRLMKKHGIQRPGSRPK